MLITFTDNEGEAFTPTQRVRKNFYQNDIKNLSEILLSSPELADNLPKLFQAIKTNLECLCDIPFEHNKVLTALQCIEKIKTEQQQESERFIKETQSRQERIRDTLSNILDRESEKAKAVAAYLYNIVSVTFTDNKANIKVCLELSEVVAGEQSIPMVDSSNAE